MNGRPIPGYYWDAEKSRYFKIQANHIAPQGAKYSRGNVKLEHRQDKKRKIETEKKVYREAHTVKRSALLQHSLTGGSGLSREHGDRASHALAHESALVHYLRPQSITVKWPNFADDSFIVAEACFIPERQQMMLASTSGNTAKSIIYVYNQWSWSKPTVSVDHCQFSGYSMHNSLVSLSSYRHGLDQRWLACGSQRHVVMGMVEPSSPTIDTWAAAHTVINMKLGKPDESIASASIELHTGTVAIAGNRNVYVLDSNANLVNTLSFGDQQWPSGIDWLDQNIVAFPHSSRHSESRIKLWDTRTEGGTSIRFDLEAISTGVVVPSNSPFSRESGFGGNQIIVSTNHHVNVFDTRMSRKARPLLSSPHIHGGPTASLASNGRSLVAAVDRDSMVQIYSTSTGTRLGMLAEPEQPAGNMSSRVLRKLAWYDDAKDGPTLQAIRGNSIVRWRWGGNDSEEA